MGKSMLTKLGSIGVAIIVALGFYFVRSKGEEKLEEAKAPDVGECVYFVKDGLNDEAKDAKCGDANASHKVVGDDGKCGENETSYQVSRPGDDAIVDLCLVLNATKGDCFDTSSEAKVPCADNKGSATVAKVVSVGKPGDKCANPAIPISYGKRDLLICMGPA